MSNYQYYEYQTPPDLQGQQPEKPKKPKKPHPGLKKFGKVVAIALVFGLVAGAAFEGGTHIVSGIVGDTESSSENSSSAKTLSTSSGKVQSTATSTATTVTDVSDIVENVMPAIVQVTNVSLTDYQTFFGQRGQYESTSAGSGIIISQDDQYIYIATNNHVVEDSKELTVTFCDDSAVTAEVQGTDESTDLAVVRVAVSDISDDTLSQIKVATIGDSSTLSVGDSAVVIGNAMGYGQSVTTGVISALDREVELESDSGTTISNKLIQTDAAVNPGNSGGALLNMNGEVVGIVSAKYVDESAEGLGYAIPISDAAPIIEQLMNNGSTSDSDSSSGTDSQSGTAYLGIQGVDIDSTTASEYNMPEGVYVAGVISGTGADKAGLQKRDVITSFNGQSVSSMKEIQSALSSLSPGDKVEVTVAQYANDYQETTLTVTLGSK